MYSIIAAAWICDGTDPVLRNSLRMARILPACSVDVLGGQLTFTSPQHGDEAGIVLCQVRRDGAETTNGLLERLKKSAGGRYKVVSPRARRTAC
jgi:hypothetical protein